MKTEMMFIMGSGLIFSLGAGTGYAYRAKEVPPISVVEHQEDVVCMRVKLAEVCSAALKERRLTKSQTPSGDLEE